MSFPLARKPSPPAPSRQPPRHDMGCLLSAPKGGDFPETPSSLYASLSTENLTDGSQGHDPSYSQSGKQPTIEKNLGPFHTVHLLSISVAHEGDRPERGRLKRRGSKVHRTRIKIEYFRYREALAALAGISQIRRGGEPGVHNQSWGGWQRYRESNPGFQIENLAS